MRDKLRVLVGDYFEKLANGSLGFWCIADELVEREGRVVNMVISDNEIEKLMNYEFGMKIMN